MPTVRTYGDRALLIECAGTAEVIACSEALREMDLPEVADIVPGAQTVLVRLCGTGLQMPIRDRLTDMEPSRLSMDHGDSGAEVVIDVVYDGADLAEVAAMLDMAIDEVVEAHTGTPWRAGFVGFAPGFAYLTPTAGSSDGPHPFHRIGRRPESRPRVPAGSVAIAAGYSAVYPRQSPGGWYLLGRTGVRLWDETADRPALLAPGTLVRFAAEGDRR